MRYTKVWHNHWITVNWWCILFLFILLLLISRMLLLLKSDERRTNEMVWIGDQVVNDFLAWFTSKSISNGFCAIEPSFPSFYSIDRIELSIPLTFPSSNQWLSISKMNESTTDHTFISCSDLNTNRIYWGQSEETTMMIHVIHHRWSRSQEIFC